jgi:hypothetical protein
MPEIASGQSNAWLLSCMKTHLSGTCRDSAERGRDRYSSKVSSHLERWRLLIIVVLPRGSYGRETIVSLRFA